METEINKLAGIIQFVLQKDEVYSAREKEVIEALDTLEILLHKWLRYNLDAALARKCLDELSKVLSNLVFNLSINQPRKNVLNSKLVINRANSLYKIVNDYLENYRPSVIIKTDQPELLPLNSFYKTLARVSEILGERFFATELYVLLQPYLNNARVNNVLCYHRWLWWLQFFPIILNNSNNNLSLEQTLTAMNFNTPEYFNWLLSNIEKEMAAKTTLSEKFHYISGLLIQYKLREECNDLAFNPAAPSLAKSMVILLKAELKNLPALYAGTQPPAQIHLREKLGTALSVPQLALFIRLMVDTNIINQPNQSSLLKQIAATMYTTRASEISPESLRINYYTPNSASKNIIKEYLINMVNRLKGY